MPSNDITTQSTPLNAGPIFGYATFEQFISGNNIGATVDQLDPSPNYGKTVWYRIAQGIPRQWPFFFSTLYNPNVGEIQNPVSTKLQIFRPISNGLQEITDDFYIPTHGGKIWREKFPYSGGVAGGGSFIVSNLISSDLYFVRVDGVDGAEGNFCLTWGHYWNPYMFACGSVLPTFNPALGCPVAQKTLNVGGAELQPFGSFGAGVYRVVYERGAWFSGNHANLNATGFFPGRGFIPRLAFRPSDGVDYFLLDPVTHQYNETQGNTQAAVELYFRGVTAEFVHGFGDINIVWRHQNDVGVIGAAPQFSLYKVG